MNKTLELNFWVYSVQQYRILVFTNSGSVLKTKQNFNKKISKKLFYKIRFCIRIYCDYSDI